MEDAHMETMIAIRNLLEQELDIKQQKECSFFMNIVEKVQQYVKIYCQHQIAEDLIDIDPDRSKTIYYCIKCETTFDNM
tara:strand:- start:825 stop:1061 length:237 start_codon:yes stop_codon:yes gene_type:complete